MRKRNEQEKKTNQPVRREITRLQEIEEKVGRYGEKTPMEGEGKATKKRDEGERKCVREKERKREIQGYTSKRK